MATPPLVVRMAGALFFLVAPIARMPAQQRVQPPAPRIVGSVIPGKDWQTATPESLGYSTRKLEALRAWVSTQQTGSMMVIAQGRVLFSYGDVTHTSKIASVRKSILGMLYGAEVMNGRGTDSFNDIALNKSVVELGLTDKTPFLPIERNATLIQLLASRSGIYIVNHDDPQAAYMPPRGSAYPGSQFVYNNWDFDAAGTAFEKLTGKTIFHALRDDLATPLGMQDFDLAKQRSNIGADSVHPEYAMYLSTRDLGRLGLLMLNCGQWNGKSLTSCGWAQYSTYLHTPFHDITPAAWRNAGEPARWGYGLLWWVWDQQYFPGQSYGGFLQGAYSAMGTGGNFITVLPTLGIVVVHKVDIDQDENRSVSPSSYIAMLSMLSDAHCGDNCR